MDKTRIDTSKVIDIRRVDNNILFYQLDITGVITYWFNVKVTSSIDKAHRDFLCGITNREEFIRACIKE